MTKICAFIFKRVVYLFYRVFVQSSSSTSSSSGSFVRMSLTLPLWGVEYCNVVFIVLFYFYFLLSYSHIIGFSSTLFILMNGSFIPEVMIIFLYIWYTRIMKYILLVFCRSLENVSELMNIIINQTVIGESQRSQTSGIRKRELRHGTCAVLEFYNEWVMILWFLKSRN